MYFAHESSLAITDLKTSETWNGEKLKAESLRRGRILAANGVTKGDRVIILHGGSLSFFADLYATWQAGACAVCLNPASTYTEVENIVNFTNARLILVSAGISKGDGFPIPVICPETLDEKGSDTSGADLDSDALMLFTSGTTGKPKGVLHTFRSLLARLGLNRKYIGDDILENTLCMLPTHFGHGLIGNCLTPITAGKHLFLGPPTSVQTASGLGKLIDASGITFMSSVPSFWKLVLKVSTEPTGSSLRRVQVGSAPLSSDLWQQIINWSGTDDVVNMYGITETANWLSGASARKGGPGDGRIGQMWGGSAAVLLENGEMLSTGEGELLVQSPSLMKEYFKRPDLTEPVLSNGWFHTGDIGRIDEDGEMWLTGRAKYEINRGGMKVHPEDIDILLERHEDVQEACAFAIPDDAIGEAVGVAICLVDGASAELNDLKAWCREHLVKEKNPDRWFFVNEIPKTDRGKINRDTVAGVCQAMKAGI
jgi:oxalate---CoA ligase